VFFGKHKSGAGVQSFVKKDKQLKLTRIEFLF
jgi:hypothetical protein